jgi:hypothetical protein
MEVIFFHLLTIKKKLLEAGCHGTFSHGNCAMRRIDFSLWTSIHSTVPREPLFPDVSNKGLGCEIQRQSSKNSGKRGKSNPEESVREYLQLNKWQELFKIEYACTQTFSTSILIWYNWSFSFNPTDAKSFKRRI